jgi:hypothetical protein
MSVSIVTEMSFRSVYDYFSSRKRKEKLDFILEPLQAMIQLSLIGYCPKGSKLTIQNNILTIHLPGMTQGLIRYFNDDNKEDIYYLMHVFRRFFLYYDFMKNEGNLIRLYNKLIELAIKGVESLILTYNNTEKYNIIHTLNLYKLVLHNPDFFKENKIDNKNDVNIDKIFNDITSIYTIEEYNILYNILKLIESYPLEYVNYIDSINLIMNHKNKKIKEWISKNIAF